MEINETMGQLIELQRIDSGLDELEKLKKGFLQAIADAEAQVARKVEELRLEKKALEELAKSRKTLEIEVGTLETKAAKYAAQEGDVKGQEQLKALEMEIAKAKSDKEAAEEKVLDLLIDEDTKKAHIPLSMQALAEVEKKAAADKQELALKIADCDKAAEEKRKERAAQLGKVEPEFAGGYESLRQHGKKIAVAFVQEDNTCSGCRMSVAPQALNEIRKNIAIQRCSCGRYLYHKD